MDGGRPQAAKAHKIACILSQGGNLSALSSICIVQRWISTRSRTAPASLSDDDKPYYTYNGTEPLLELGIKFYQKVP